MKSTTQPIVTIETLVDNDEAARRLDVNIPMLKRLRLAGIVPAIRLGPRTVRYKPSDLAAVIERLRKPGIWERRAAK